MQVTLFGIEMEVNSLHAEKAWSPIVVTDSGIVIWFKELQPENVDGLIKVSVFGRFTSVKAEQ